MDSEQRYKQLSDTSTYDDVKKCNDKLLSQLTQKSNKFFKRLCNYKLISEKELIYFSYNLKNASCLDKMYLLPKTQKRLYDVPGRPVISNYRTPFFVIFLYILAVTRFLI